MSRLSKGAKLDTAACLPCSESASRISTPDTARRPAGHLGCRRGCARRAHTGPFRADGTSGDTGTEAGCKCPRPASPRPHGNAGVRDRCGRRAASRACVAGPREDRRWRSAGRSGPGVRLLADRQASPPAFASGPASRSDTEGGGQAPTCSKVRRRRKNKPVRHRRGLGPFGEAIDGEA